MAKTQDPIFCSDSLDNFPSQIICFVRLADTATNAATCTLVTHITASSSSTHAALATLNKIMVTNRLVLVQGLPFLKVLLPYDLPKSYLDQFYWAISHPAPFDKDLMIFDPLKLLNRSASMV